MAKTKEQKQAEKAAKQAAKQQQQQERYASAAADGKISRSELTDIFGKKAGPFGGMSREQQATELAKFAIGNPNVQIGKGVTEQTGLKIRKDESGGRVATYTPQMIGGGFTLSGSPAAQQMATPNFGKANTSWSATAGGMYRFGGAPAAPMAAPAAPAASPEAPAFTPTAELSPEALAYRQQADATLASADALLNQFRIEQNQAEEARKLQERLYIQSQAAATANMARSQMAPNLQIQPASGTPQTAGTQGFKRRQRASQPQGALSALNTQSPSTLNI